MVIDVLGVGDWCVLDMVGVTIMVVIVDDDRVYLGLGLSLSKEGLLIKAHYFYYILR